MQTDFYISKIECYAVWYQALTEQEKNGIKGRFILGRMIFYSELVQQVMSDKYNKVGVCLTFELN